MISFVENLFNQISHPENVKRQFEDWKRIQVSDESSKKIDKDFEKLIRDNRTDIMNCWNKCIRLRPNAIIYNAWDHFNIRLLKPNSFISISDARANQGVFGLIQ
jgi:hypothetical protein